MLEHPLNASSYGKLLEAARDAIKDANLEDLPDDRILIRKRCWYENLPLPCCVLSPFGGSAGLATNQEDDNELGILVTLCAASNRDLEAGMGTELLWNQRVRKTFSNRCEWIRGAGLEFVRSRVTDMTFNVQQAFAFNIDAMFLLVRATIREDRD